MTNAEREIHELAKVGIKSEPANAKIVEMIEEAHLAYGFDREARRDVVVKTYWQGRLEALLDAHEAHGNDVSKWRT